ncbi:hypothetical protein P378_03305 [Desulforamulus profundi]|uniref:Uncharacterized protein n=1 Tax=Desulforamulus profundi TaxID=1383067 RepID=A0A2C6MDS6_9FIRM|nr:hypothetical protein P378_03305 [Desulforamulus profundi]
MKEYKVVVIQPDQDQCLSDAQNLDKKEIKE